MRAPDHPLECRPARARENETMYKFRLYGLIAAAGLVASACAHTSTADLIEASTAEIQPVIDSTLEVCRTARSVVERHGGDSSEIVRVCERAADTFRTVRKMQDFACSIERGSGEPDPRNHVHQSARQCHNDFRVEGQPSYWANPAGIRYRQFNPFSTGYKLFESDGTDRQADLAGSVRDFLRLRFTVCEGMRSRWSGSAKTGALLGKCC